MISVHQSDELRDPQQGKAPTRAAAVDHRWPLLVRTMSGKRGRPKGSKDSKARSSGRWSEQTRQKHGAPPAVKAPVLPKHSIAAALAGAARRTNGAAAAQSTAPSRDPAGAPPPAGDQGERAAGSGRVDDESEGEAAAEPPDDEPEEEEPPERAAAGDEPGA